MALSGSFSGSIHSGHYKLRVDWSATQSVANNTSTITCKMYLVQGSNYGLSISARTDNTCTIDGTQKTFSSPKISNSGGTTTLLGTVSRTVTHAADGTKKVNLAAAFHINATISGTKYTWINASASNISLDTIPRATTPTVSESSMDLGSSVTISTPRAASAFTHTLKATYGGHTETIATSVATSYSWTPSVATWAQYCTTATSGTCTITCETYNGSTKIGSKTVNMTLTIPESIVPTVSLATEGVDLIWDLYIQTKSKCKVTATAAGAQGSTITSYSIKQDETQIATSASVTTDVLNNSGTVTFTATVKDSRGRTATATKTITVTAYKLPSFLSVVVTRCLADGTPQRDGTRMLTTFSHSYSSCEGNNSVTLTVTWKERRDDTWATPQTLTNGGVYNAPFSTNRTYDVELRISDLVSPSVVITYTDILSTAFTLLNFRKFGKGMAIGKVSERDALEVALEGYFDEGIYGRKGSTGDYIDILARLEQLFFKPTDTWTISYMYPANGFVIDNGKEIGFVLVSPKDLSDITTVDCSGLSIAIRQANHYLHGTTADCVSITQLTDYTNMEVVKVNNRVIRVRLYFSAKDANTINNDALAVDVKGTITFT